MAETAFYKSLVKALGELCNPKKSGEANAGAYGYTYPELDKIVTDVRVVFAKHGLAVMQDTANENGTIGVRTIILHESGEKVESSWLHIAAGSGAQANGSAITYARRYSLMAFLGLAGEDDDGAAATEGIPPKTEDKPPEKTPEKTPGGASKKSLGLARGLAVTRGIARPGRDGETEDEMFTRREQSNLAVREWLVKNELPRSDKEDDLSNLNQRDLSKVIDALKAEIAEMGRE